MPSSIQRYLEDAPFDVLFLFDCCHLIHPKSGLETLGIKEVLVADGYETIVAEVGDHSFTRLLVDQLARAAVEGRSVSASHLHGDMLGSFGDYDSRTIRERGGQIALDANNLPSFEIPRRRTPVHYFMSQNHQSIVLAPFRRNPDPAPSGLVLSPPTSQDAASLTGAETSGHGEGITLISKEEMHPQVLLRVLLDSPATTNVPAWVEWISNAPVEARDIRVEGWYGSFSTLVMLNVSIGIWHSLPDNPAISFLGYVTTQNLASSLNLSAAQARVANVRSLLGILDPEPAGQPLHSFDPIRRDTGGSTVSRPSNPE